MKILFIVLLVFIGGSAWAENWIQKDNVKSSIPEHGPTSSKALCEQIHGPSCFDKTGKDVRRWKIGLIDDLTQPKYRIGADSSQPCTDEDSCQPLYEALDCSSYQSLGDYPPYPVKVAELTEVYCAEPYAYKQIDAWVPDDDGATEADRVDGEKSQEVTDRKAKVGPRFNALKLCAVNADSLTNSQLRICFRKMIKEVLSPRLPLSEL